MSTQAFGPRGLTTLISCNDVASASVQVTSLPAGCYTYQLVNTGGNAVHFAYHSQKGVVAALPAAGTPANGVPVLPNEIVIYNLTPNAWFSAICASGLTTTLEVTPGEGM